MRASVLFVVVALVRAAAAQPGLADPRAAFEACKARRRAQLSEAMKIADAQQRGHRLLAIEDCTPPRVDEPIATVEPPPPVVLGPWAAIAVGISASAMSYGNPPQLPVPIASDPSRVLVVNGPSNVPSSGPLVELEVGWRFERRASLGVFVAYVPSSATYIGQYELHHDEVDAGVRARLHFGRASVAVGMGVDVDRAAAIRNVLVFTAFDSVQQTDIAGYTTPLLLTCLDTSVDLAHRGRSAVELKATLAYAHTTEHVDRLLALDGDVISGRIALGVRY